MERKIGETFEYQGKTYKVAEFDDCRNCAFIHINCSSLRSITGNCMDFLRNDGANVKFEEVKDMEIKDNQLTINIPEGMEIDAESSDFKSGVIKFKKKEIRYEDIEGSLDIKTFLIPISVNNSSKIKAIDKLIDIAEYYNGNWKPDWSNNKEGKFYISYNFIHNVYFVIEDNSNNVGTIVFKHKEDTQKVINNPNFREILDAIYNN